MPRFNGDVQGLPNFMFLHYQDMLRTCWMICRVQSGKSQRSSDTSYRMMNVTGWFAPSPDLLHLDFFFSSFNLADHAPVVLTALAGVVGRNRTAFAIAAGRYAA